MSRLTELVSLIAHHKNTYYNHPENAISDDEYDALVDELAHLDPSNSILTEIGAPPDDSAWVKKSHHILMGSLDKVTSYDQLYSWAQKLPDIHPWKVTHSSQELRDWVGGRSHKSNTYKVSYCVQEKLDGFGIELGYQKGVLTSAVTRGGGTEGEDIYRNVVQMKGVKLVLSDPLTGYLRGEILLRKEDLTLYNEEAAQNGWRQFKNTRNGAAGLARRFDGTGVNHLTLYVYDLQSEDFKFASQYTKMNTCVVLGFLTPWFEHSEDISGVKRIFENHSVIRSSLPYDIDGMVIKINELDVAEELRGSANNPKDQIAWKFPSEMTSTTLLGVEWEMGLGGRITPVAILEPVVLCGVTISRASLHNVSNVRNLGLTMGCGVLITRSQDVIPQVLKKTSEGTSAIEVPTQCKSCGKPLFEDGEYIRCQNQDCRGNIIGKIRKWIVGLEVDFFGEDLIDRLVTDHNVKSILDLYTVDPSSFSGIGDKTVKRAFNNLLAKKEVPLHVAIGSLNITAFGKTLARVVVQSKKGSKNLLQDILDMNCEDLCSLPQFDVIRATDVRNGLQDNAKLLLALSHHITFTGEPCPVQGPLSGKSFCITGSLDRPKKDYERMILDSGGVYETSVKAGLTYLIAQSGSTSSKTEKAKKLGVQVIAEADLLSMIKEA